MCVWDLDGTLMNTLPTLHYYNNLSLQHFGFQPVDYDKFTVLIKYPLGKYYQELLKMGGCPEEKIDEIADEFTQYDYEHYAVDPTLHIGEFPGVRETLNKLCGMGIRNTVLSNKYEDISKKIVSCFYPQFIEAVYGQIASSPSKPQIGCTDRMFRESGLKKDEILIVGDTEVDMLTAKNNHFPVAAVTWGYQDAEVLRQYQPDHMIDEPSQLIDIIKEINHV